MNVTIQERKCSFQSEFDISAPTNGFYAKKVFFGNSISLQTRSHQDVARLRSRLSFLRNKYDFEFGAGVVYHFQCVKRFKGVYLCERDEDRFYLYRHKGFRYSVFQGDHQIAAISRNRVIIGKGNRYDIVTNTNANLIIIVCMMLAINTSDNDDRKEGVTYDFGSIGPEEKPFDESWKPIS
jgi:uncharacterized protein YxjI